MEVPFPYVIAKAIEKVLLPLIGSRRERTEGSYKEASDWIRYSDDDGIVQRATTLTEVVFHEAARQKLELVSQRLMGDTVFYSMKIEIRGASVSSLVRNKMPIFCSMGSKEFQLATSFGKVFGDDKTDFDFGFFCSHEMIEHLRGGMLGQSIVFRLKVSPGVYESFSFHVTDMFKAKIEYFFSTLK